jgi:hypothetical protein
MTEYSFLDIHPSKRIADQVDAQDPDFRLVKELVNDATVYIKTMEEENPNQVETGGDQSLDTKETRKYVRSRDRTRNTRMILQYLITFISHLPLEQEIEVNYVNPFEHLKSFALTSIDLIKEKDVAAAILREHQLLGLLNEANYWYYRGQIDKSYKELREQVEKATRATLDDYSQLFMGLHRLSTFWFSVRNEDIKRVRKSDILMYKLTRVLLAKYKNSQPATQ